LGVITAVLAADHKCFITADQESFITDDHEATSLLLARNSFTYLLNQAMKRQALMATE